MMPPKKIAKPELTPALLDGRIHVVRGVRVMLDSDVAELYGVPTKRINEQLARNPDKFPSDFAFQLTQQEFANLKSQIATSSSAHGGRRKLPWVFTEHDVAGLSGVLRSKTADQVYVEIMRAFIRVRSLLGTPGELASRLLQLAETVKLHDDQIRTISEVLRRMLTPPPEDGPKRRIGFHPHEPQPSPEANP